MAAVGFLRCWLRFGGVQSVAQGSRIRSRLCSGLATLQTRAAVTAGPWKSIPLAHKNIPGVRFVSGFSPLLSSPAASPSILSATQLNPVLGIVACRHNLSILKSTLPGIFHQPSRTKTYFGYRKGKSKTVKAVVKRFLRLHCGLWVRKKAGYKKKLWKKAPARRKRLREQVFCNRTQCKLLDKMTTSFWKRRNWFVDDEYQKYHDRTNLKF